MFADVVKMFKGMHVLAVRKALGGFGVEPAARFAAVLFTDLLVNSVIWYVKFIKNDCPT